ncbi:flagellar biosynthesis protein FlgA [Haloechinothrix sp. YIM 98757]|uniref:Flagellar biosynthesis protein FlgA n=1 Tax=Haloechinothrix aidingensis TaxID=2752311 RepID=A0A838A9Q3_9PSEU|nr:SAF domain-containing protein [Haloechinothrix aidingensis]MBA0125541.1 flagellar biosynthesis protein FlgA [Haloechinothrix aidingensis]
MFSADHSDQATTSPRAASLPALLRRRFRRPRRRGPGGGAPRAVQVRRALAASLFALAAALALAPTGADVAAEPVLTTTADLASGSELEPGDLRVTTMPTDLAPAGALDSPDAAVGKVLSGAARAGEPLTDARLIEEYGGELSGHPGKTAVPVRLSDAGVAELLRPGTTVDVIAPGTAEQDGRVVAEEATVLTVRADTEDRLDGLGGSGRLVLLALDPGTASDVAAVSLHSPVTVTLR